MDIEVKSWLFDIHKAILEIDSFIVDMREDFTSYQNDLKTRRAVERNIEIMGEAMARILKKIHPYSSRMHARSSIPAIGSFMGTIPYQTRSFGG